MASHPAEPRTTIGLTILAWDAVTTELERYHPALAADLAVAVHAQVDRLGLQGVPVTVVPISLSPANACLVHEAAVTAVRLDSGSVHDTNDTSAGAAEDAITRNGDRPRA